MFEATLEKAQLLKMIVESIKDLVNDANIEVRWCGVRFYTTCARAGQRDGSLTAGDGQLARELSVADAPLNAFFSLPM